MLDPTHAIRVPSPVVVHSVGSGRPRPSTKVTLSISDPLTRDSASVSHALPFLSPYIPPTTASTTHGQQAMAPIRRYLRITKYSVLEVRIYLDRPTDAEWLLKRGDPALPHVIQAVRPLVLPKLREENERGKGKGGSKSKKKGVKDVVVEGL